VTELTLIAIGIVMQSATFALGILVGASLRRRGHDDCNGYEEAKEYWHHATGRHAQDSARGRVRSGADATGEAGARVHPNWRWHTHGD
jgi:hypothetical protein